MCAGQNGLAGLVEGDIGQALVFEVGLEGLFVMSAFTIHGRVPEPMLRSNIVAIGVPVNPGETVADCPGNPIGQSAVVYRLAYS